MKHYYCHFCPNFNKCKPTGWIDNKPTGWTCFKCFTYFCLENLPNHNRHYIVFRTEFNNIKYALILDIINQKTEIWPISIGGKEIIVDTLPQINPSNKDEWIARLLNLKAFQ